jgi:hypothetical protein
MNRYTIAPDETLDFAFNFNGPAPGPALRPGQTLAGATVTVAGGLVLDSQQIAGDAVVLRVTCPDSVPLGTRTAIRCRVTTGGTGAGEVFVDQMDVLVAL